jgi:hypothetical protein
MAPFQVPLDDAYEVANVDIPLLEWLSKLTI